MGIDKNTIIGIILIIAIFIVTSVINNSRKTKAFENAVEVAEAEVAKGNLERARTEYVNALRYKPNQPEVIEKISELNVKLGITPEEPETDTTQVEELHEEAPSEMEPVSVDASRYGAFAGAVQGSEELIILENNKIELTISPKGGRIYSALLKEYTTHDSLPLILFSGDSTNFGFNFFTADNKAVLTNELFFIPEREKKYYVVESEPQSVVLRLPADDDNRYIEYKYTLAPDKYSVDFDVTFKNLNTILPANQNSITLDWRMYIPQQEKGRQNEENYTTIKYKYYQDEVDQIRLRQSKEVEQVDITTKLSWIAFQDQFFSSVLISEDFFLNGMVTSTRTLTSEEYIRYFTAEVGVPFDPGSETKLEMRFFYGPNHISTLRKEGLELDKIVFLGKNVIGWINRFVIIPIFNWLEKYIGSYGIIILILTILIKVVLFPLTFKSFQSQAKMQVLKPMVEELGKKFPKKEDAMKKQQATMDLYKKAGANPMGGCLPTLLQFPILFAMFRFFPTSIELRQQSFLWAQDLRPCAKQLSRVAARVIPVRAGRSHGRLQPQKLIGALMPSHSSASG